jgi:hypothetical protein
MLTIGSNVTDGYFAYTLVALTSDGWATVRLHGHLLRVQVSSLRPN